MRRTISYEIKENEVDMAVRDVLLAHGYSKALIDEIKHQEMGLTVNGENVYAKQTVQSGDRLVVTLPEEKNDDWITPEKTDLDIVYEDDDLLVINKAAGILVHPTKNHPTGTLANGLMEYFSEKGEPFTCRITNRLDRDTTGLLLIPRHALSACVLSSTLAKHKIHRTYLAAAEGDVRDTFPDGEGMIDAPIARVPGEGMLREVNFTSGEEARTHVKVLSYNPEKDASLCAVTLETGRTHQIRVHFSYIRHPLFGDFLYNPDYRLINRQSLHSYRLNFAHPISGEMMEFTAPVPEDMKIFLPEE